MTKQMAVVIKAWIAFSKLYAMVCNAYVEGRQKQFYLSRQSSEHHYVLTPSLFLISSAEKESDIKQM
jgi:hypothetical protein